jgi:hypothetical protein
MLINIKINLQVHVQTPQIQYACDICSCATFAHLKDMIEHRKNHSETEYRIKDPGPWLRGEQLRFSGYSCGRNYLYVCV